jgi:hypothetical protein
MYVDGVTEMMLTENHGGLSAWREVLTWNGEEQSFRFKERADLEHCLSETWKRERRQTEACLFRLREKAVSHSFYSPCCQGQDCPFPPPPLITNEHHPSHPAYTPSQSDPEDSNSVFLRIISIHFQD